MLDGVGAHRSPTAALRLEAPKARVQQHGDDGARGEGRYGGGPRGDWARAPRPTIAGIARRPAAAAVPRSASRRVMVMLFPPDIAPPARPGYIRFG